ncbi:MAG: hypothetical protein M3O36_03600, partial [Myxococcota bacterium]|nr:hypothetical protein [Myxococcota bacterium]
PEPVTTPLLAALGRVVAVTASGAVWTWTPGASEPIRVATFEGPIDGSAAMADDGHTLVAVAADQTHVAVVDLLHGSRGSIVTRVVAPAGSVWLGPPAMRRGTAHLLLLSPTGELAAEVATGVSAELASVRPRLLHARTAPSSGDGGTALLTWFAHTAPLVDDAGTVAFATIGGDLGVASTGGVELLVEACAARTSHADEGGEPPAPSARIVSPVVAGLAPLGPGVLVAACRSGNVVAVHGVMAALAPPLVRR